MHAFVCQLFPIVKPIIVAWPKQSPLTFFGNQFDGAFLSFARALAQQLHVSHVTVLRLLAEEVLLSSVIRVELSVVGSHIRGGSQPLEQCLQP